MARRNHVGNAVEDTTGTKPNAGGSNRTPGRKTNTQHVERVVQQDPSAEESILEEKIPSLILTTIPRITYPKTKSCWTIKQRGEKILQEEQGASWGRAWYVNGRHDIM